MRHIRAFFLAGALSAGIGLGGCASTGGTTPTATDLRNIISQVQQATVTACSFLPTTSTVANIIGAAAGVGPETQFATTIAAQICAAISPAVSARRGGAAPSLTIDGKTIVIHGRFVK